MVLGGAAHARAYVPSELQGQRVVQVRVEGATEGLTPARDIGIPLGAPVSRRLLRGALRRLLRTGHWADVQLDLVPMQGGVRVVAHLVPRLLVERLEIVGNQVIDDDDLARIVGLKKGTAFRRQELGAIEEAVENAYAEHGYEAATVHLRVWDTDDPFRKVVRVEIHEGKPTRITALRFVGDAPPPGSGVTGAIHLERGDVLDRKVVNDGVRKGEERLRKEGWLSAKLGPASFEAHGDGMAVVVPARIGPRYHVVIIGAAPMDRREVFEALKVGEERLAGATNLEAMRGRVADLYRRHGFQDAKVKVFTLPGKKPGAAALVVAIEPGKALDVVRVTFPGASFFKRSFLRSQVFSFLEDDLGDKSILEPVDTDTVNLLGFGGDTRWRGRTVPRPLEVHPEQVYYEPSYEHAVEHLHELYQSQGFLQVKVGPARLERLGDHRARVVVPILEGPRTLLHSVELEGNRALATGTLLEGTKLERDMPFSHLALEQARLAIQEVYQDHGYYYAHVDSEVKYSEDHTRAQVTFRVVERYPVHVGQVVIRGAKRTKHSLVLDRVPLHRGSLLVPSRMREAQKRLSELGVFNSVTVAPQDADLPERVKNVVVTVTERPTQYIDFSAGVSTGEGVRGGFEYGYRNLFGYALGLSLRVQLGHQFFFLDPQLEREYQQLSLADRLERLVSLSLTIPHIHGLENVTTSLSLFDQRDNERGFGLDKNGVNVTFVYRPVPWLTLSASEDLENSDLQVLLGKSYDDLIQSTTDRRLQKLLRVPEGRSTLVATRATAAFDFRDNPFTPTKGVFISTSLEWARTLSSQSVAVGTTNQTFFSNHLKLTLSTTGYVPITKRVVFAAQVRYGRVIHLSPNSETYPNRLFYLGGADTLRGYFEDALIPQDLADQIRKTGLDPNSVPRGGDTFLLLRGELRFPISGDIRGGIFADVGNLWKQANKLDPFDLRPTAGVGLRIATPVGPLAFDYGFVLLRRDYLDERFGAFHFSIGVF